MSIKSVAHYYGYPSAVNGAAGDVPTAAAVFGAYDVVVFGQGIEDSSHPDHTNTVNIIADSAMSNTEVFGYIDTVQEIDDIQEKIDNWYTMGVKGIFLDKFGYDFGNTRDHQNACVWSIHEKGANTLKAYVNAWNPDDVFSSALDPTHNPNALAPRIESGDIYLLESYQIVQGNYQTQADWRSRSDKVIGYRSSFPGVETYGLTTYDSSAFDQSKADYSYNSALLDALEGWGWGEEFFSASGSMADQLPFRSRNAVSNGTKNIGSIIVSGNTVEVQQNLGITIDTSAHTVANLLVTL